MVMINQWLLLMINEWLLIISDYGLVVLFGLLGKPVVTSEQAITSGYQLFTGFIWSLTNGYWWLWLINGY